MMLITKSDLLQVGLGATQKNELERGLLSMQMTQQNLIAAESDIRDADIMLTYSKLSADIMKMHFGLSLMAHSNITSKGIIDLIGK